ncbi:hypothetical protein A9Q99_17470 [Gammaproteobacteria bacterium 45_16_T64]|nr:hypothetical protein A9Q99_17470 [Gammaproteobacteria bacterium 45_16_T64]
MLVEKKFVVYCLMLLKSVIVGAIYSIIHDQIIYTFSPDYFHRFKFIEYSVDWAGESPRLAVSFVGVLSGWWIALLLGAIPGTFGLFFIPARIMFRELMKTCMLIVLILEMSGLLGILFGYSYVNIFTWSDYIDWVRPGVLDPVSFLRMRFAYIAGYIGCVVGLIVGLGYLGHVAFTQGELRRAEAE